MDQGWRDSDLYRTIANEMDDIIMHESILKLDDAQFRLEEFSIFAKETMQRYKHSNQELFKLVLKMKIHDDDCASLATELIMDALNLSVKKLHIEISYSRRRPLVLPCQVFESSSLIELSAEYCIVNQPINEDVTCLPLVSLTLISVTINDDMMRDILSRCPLIEYLHLLECRGLTKLFLGETQRNIKHCLVEHMEYTDGGFFVNFFDTRFPNLTSLVFNELRLEKTFFHESMNKFPCLVELSLHNCYGLEEVVEISIPSLKFLIVEWMWETRLIFDVPNICKFRYSGYNEISPLHINARSNGLEYCNITISLIDDLPHSWFLRLREFLQNLSIVSKKISLCLTDDKIDNLVIEKEDISGVAPCIPVSGVAPCIPVENLVFKYLLCDGMSLSNISNLVSGLFSICRPNMITLIEGKNIPPLQPSKRHLPIIELLCKSVTEKANWKCELKQVLLEMLFEEEETLTEWRPILWEDLVSSLRLNIDGIQIRLKLAWHEGLN